MTEARPATTNRLLGAIPGPALARLVAAFEPVALAVGDVVVREDTAIDHVLFVDSGLVSVVVAPSSPDAVEIGIVGCEGLVGIAAVLGAERSPHRAFVQIAGKGRRVATASLAAILEDHPSARDVLLRYAHCYMVQISAASQANAVASVEQRLARWLLLCQDRTGDAAIPLTHDFLSVMLSVRRPGITVATHGLEGAGAIRARRGLIVVRDRERLIALAGETYGTAEAEYARIFGENAQATDPDRQPPAGDRPT